MKKLSIIIPFYNTPDYTEELLTVLEPQLTDEVEVMLVDGLVNGQIEAAKQHVEALVFGL